MAIRSRHDGRSSIRLGGPLALAAVLVGCGAPGAMPGPDGGGGGGRDSGCASAPPACDGDDELVCRADGVVARRTCDLCVPGIGCATCVPGRGSCEGDTARLCREDGSGWDEVETCDPAAGTVCNATFGACVDLCAEAAEARSYRGCEYWPVTTINHVLERTRFAFAAVVANPQEHPVTITITRGDTVVDEQVIDAGQSRAIELPWVEELQTPSGSARVAAGAYRLRSSLPVTVHQYNPLHYQSGTAYSYTNDASLLLPTSALGTHYVATTRPTWAMERAGGGLDASPGFVAIVGTEDATELDLTASAHVLATTDRSVVALAPGESAHLTLARGEVLQLLSAAPDTCDAPASSGDRYCAVAREYDLTGTDVRASHPIEVIAGHSCAFVAYDRPSCDHLEESLFPVEAWGDSALVVPTQPFRDEPHVVRVVSATDDNALSFDPAGAHAAVTLDRGEILELETRAALAVTGSDAIEVAQFMVGQDYAFPSEGGQGDPSMSIVVPTEQFRSEYQILTPGTYQLDVLNVIAPAGTSVQVDGLRVAGFAPIGATGFSFARVPVSAGAHEVTGSAPFGVVSYGFADFTSYMVPGGLDLVEINPPF